MPYGNDKLSLAAIPGYDKYDADNQTILSTRANGLESGFSAHDSDTWSYRVVVSSLAFQIDEIGAEKERYTRLQREIDDQELFWPVPTE